MHIEPKKPMHEHMYKAAHETRKEDMHAKNFELLHKLKSEGMKEHQHPYWGEE